MTKFGAAVRRVDERLAGVDLPLLSVSQTRGVLRRSELTDKPPRAESLDVYKICRAGDVVFNKMSIRAGAMGVAREDGLVTYHYEVMRPTRGTDARYIVYLMKSAWFIGELIARERGIGAGDQAGVRTTEVPFRVLRTIDAYIPDHAEQRLIADFLDSETSKIQALIGKQEQLIETLRERRATVVAFSVSQGLDPHPELLPTGVEWIGSAPPRWKVTTLKHLCAVQTGITLGADPKADAVDTPYLRVANVQAGGLDLAEVKLVPVSPVDLDRYLLRDGDVLMTEGGDIDKLGRGCIWRGEIDVCIHQNHVFAVRCGERLENRFLTYLLESPIGRIYFEMTAKRSTNLASTNSTTLGNFSFALPGLSEQLEIVDYLDSQVARIDHLIDRTRAFIELSKERRSALISAAVTGQIDVRGETDPDDELVVSREGVA